MKETKEVPTRLKGYTATTLSILKQIHKTSTLIKSVSKSKFSVVEEPKKSRINILLHPLAQLYTVPEPQKSIENLKIYYLRSLREKGVEIKRDEADRIIDPILKDFLERIFSIAEKAQVQPPESYKKIHEEL